MYSSTLFTLVLSALPALAAPNLKMAVDGPPSVTDVDSFIITTTITNIGDEPATLANDPNSVLTSEWKTNVFNIVSDSGVPAQFKGAMVKWSPEEAIKAGDVTVIQPGETRTITQDLSGVYDFSASGEGAYTITPLEDFQLVSSEGKLSPIAAVVTPFLAKVTGKLTSSKRARSAGPARLKRAIFNGCSTVQQTKIRAAATAATTLIEDSSMYLNSHTSSTPRYVTWFGSYTAARANTVKTHFQNMMRKPMSASYDCSCTDAGVYAYVYPDQPYNIFLCGAFWKAPTMGTDSMAGTIVHEMSHFKVVAGTGDYAYGQADCKGLAQSNPAKAVMNADSHEYFAENTPLQA